MLKQIYKSSLKSAVATGSLALLVCGVYPAVVTVFGKILFPDQASGGRLERDGKLVGAKLIGQVFTRPEYFHGRPSLAGSGYDATSSSGSNLGPTNQKFHDSLKSNLESVLKENPDLKWGEVPNDLVTASGSGLDPHVSPRGAWVQVGRVSKARGINSDQLKSLIDAHTTGPQWGIFGEPTVNILVLNLELDRAYPLHAQARSSGEGLQSSVSAAGVRCGSETSFCSIKQK